MCSYFIRHFSPLGIAQASLALLSLIEKVRSFGVFWVIFSHFVHFVPLSHVRQNEFLIHFAEREKGSSFSTAKLLSKQQNLAQNTSQNN